MGLSGEECPLIRIADTSPFHLKKITVNGPLDQTRGMK